MQIHMQREREGQTKREETANGKTDSKTCRQETTLQGYSNREKSKEEEKGRDKETSKVNELKLSKVNELKLEKPFWRRWEWKGYKFTGRCTFKEEIHYASARPHTRKKGGRMGRQMEC